MRLSSVLAAITVSLALFSGCASKSSCPQVPASEPEEVWQSRLDGMLPLLGHRNWIVITDMAYPLQSGQGITTIYADQPYLEVLKTVNEKVKAAPHVFAHVYNDKELEYITEEMVPGIGELRSGIRSICGSEAKSVMHEELISRLDEAGKLFSVLIIKTPQTIPYTTTFFELDCAYWDSARQAALDALVR